MYNKSMQLLHRAWKHFLAQPDIWFFYAFLATATLSIRKVLYFYPINSQFNEYSGIYLYLSDIFILLTVTLWVLSKLYNNNYKLSIIASSIVPRGTFKFIALFVLWAFISILWSPNNDLAFFRLIKILELLAIIIYTLKEIVPRGTILKNSLIIIIASALVQSAIGIWQFIIQQSIGLFWLKESLIGPDILGVAKIILHGEKFIRSYGLFPHPNIFGGFLFVSILLTYLYHKLFHVEHSDTYTDANCSTWNNNACEAYNPRKIVPRGTILSNMHLSFKLTFCLQLIALFFTFSKSAIIGLFVATIYIYIKSNVPRETKPGQMISWGIKNVPHGTFLIKRALLILLIGLTLFTIIKPDLYSLFFKSLNDRMFYVNVSRGTIIDNPFFGSGIGQFIITMQSHTNLRLSDWQFQPVHNVFLLIWSELGVIGMILFILLLWKLFHVKQINQNKRLNCPTPALHLPRQSKAGRLATISGSRGGWNNNLCEACNLKNGVPRGTIENNIVISIFGRGLLLGIIFIMLFDHYFWTMQQGQIILWLTIALAYSKEKTY